MNLRKGVSLWRSVVGRDTCEHMQASGMVQDTGDRATRSTHMARSKQLPAAHALARDVLGASSSKNDAVLN